MEYHEMDKKALVDKFCERIAQETKWRVSLTQYCTNNSYGTW